MDFEFILGKFNKTKVYLVRFVAGGNANRVLAAVGGSLQARIRSVGDADLGDGRHANSVFLRVVAELDLGGLQAAVDVVVALGLLDECASFVFDLQRNAR